MRRSALLAITLPLFALGCHARTAADERHDYCEDAWTSIELFPPGTEPTRPYQIVSAVDAMIYPTPERRAKKMQFKACMLHADAVLDRTEPAVFLEERQTLGPWGTVVTTRTRSQNPTLTPGKGYAIRWVDGAAASGRPAADVPPTAYAR
jgi:hypothetical protein